MNVKVYLKDNCLPNGVLIIGLSDPFVLVKLGKKTVFKSSIKSGTLNPLWDETFEVVIHSGMPETIVFEVLDHDLFKSNDLLGLTHLSTSQIIKEGFSGWLKLEHVEKGELHVEAEYLPPEISGCRFLSSVPARNVANREPEEIFSNDQELTVCFNLCF